MKLTREVKTGLLAVVAILLFIFGYSFLKGANLLENHRTFYVKYQNVEGLAKSAPVTINGLHVGKVQDIKFANKTGGLVVEFTVEEDFDFSKNSLVRIYSSGLIGGKSIGVFPVYDPSNIAKSGDTLSGEIEQSMLDAVSARLGPLEAKVTNTLAGLDTLFLGLNDILDDRTRSHLRAAIANLNQTAISFSSASKNLDLLLLDNKDAMGRAIANFETTSQNMASLTDSLSQLDMGALVADLQNIIARFDQITTGIENGDGSMGKLLKDDELYNNLTGASKELEALLEDMRLNPKRYVHFSLFGKKPKEYEAPADIKQ